MLCLVGMLAWEVKVEGSRLRHMGERPGTLVFLNGRFLVLRTKDGVKGREIDSLMAGRRFSWIDEPAENWAQIDSAFADVATDVVSGARSSLSGTGPIDGGLPLQS